jgi:hypothetical protein
MASNEPPVWRSHYQEAKRGEDGRAAHPVELGGDWGVAPPVCATGVSLIARGCLRGATPRGQLWTSAVTLPPGRNGLSARRMAVLSTCRAPSLCRHVRRELLRNAWLDVTLIIPATACHQRNDVGRYSRSKSVAAINHIAQKQVVQRAPCSRRDFPYEPSTRPPGG